MKGNLVVVASLAAFAAAAAPASALNPQPLPPKSVYLKKYNNVLLNPQPLPPCTKCYNLFRFNRLYRA